MPVNVSVPANISVLQTDFECHGNEKSLLGCLDSKSYSYTCEKHFLKALLVLYVKVKLDYIIN